MAKKSPFSCTSQKKVLPLQRKGQNTLTFCMKIAARIRAMQWAEDIQDELTELINQHFALPFFEFVYDEHWDLGHGWSGDF